MQRRLQSFRKILKYTGVESDRLASLRYDEPLTPHAPHTEPSTRWALQHSPEELFHISPNGTGISSAAGSLLWERRQNMISMPFQDYLISTASYSSTATLPKEPMDNSQGLWDMIYETSHYYRQQQDSQSQNIYDQFSSLSFTN